MGACRSLRHLLTAPSIRSDCHAAVRCRTSSKPGLLKMIICKMTGARTPVCRPCHRCLIAQSPWKCIGNHIKSTRAGKHAEFLEQLALRSLAGGNVEAAINRLGLCKDALLAEVSSSGYTSELSYRLGNVIGTQVVIYCIWSICHCEDMHALGYMCLHDGCP